MWFVSFFYVNYLNNYAVEESQINSVLDVVRKKLMISFEFSVTIENILSKVTQPLYTCKDNIIYKSRNLSTTVRSEVWFFWNRQNSDFFTKSGKNKVRFYLPK